MKEDSTKPRRLIRIASGCKTTEQFVAVFYRFCDGDSIFIATKTPKSVGAALKFSVTLTDGDKLIEGSGIVDEAYEDKSGPYNRPGMLLRFDEISEGSKPLIKQLVAARNEKVKARVPKSPSVAVPTKPRAPTKMGIPRPVPPGMIGVKKNPQGSKRATALGLPPPIAPTPARAPTPPPIPAAARRRSPSESVDIGWDDDPKDKGPSVEPPASDAPPLAFATADEKPPAFSDEVKTEVDTPALALTPNDDVVTASDADGGVIDSGADLDTVGDGLAVVGSDEEVRVQGSNFILPANPLTEFEDESLEAFIDCKLYEEDSEEPEAETAAAVEAMGAPSADLAPFEKEPSAVMEESSDEIESVAPATAAAATAAVLESEEHEVLDRPLPLRHALIGAAAVLVVGIGLGYLLFGRGGGEAETKGETAIAATRGAESATKTATAPETTTAPKPGPAPAPEPAATPAPEPATAPEPEPEPATAPEPAPEPEPEPATAPEPAPEPEPEPVSAIGSDCSVRVEAPSKGASVFLGKEKLGTAPGPIPIPCGEVALRVEHPRRKTTTVKVDASPGETTTVIAKMVRPSFKLRIRSSPVGATIRVGGRSVGKAPRTITVTGYERVKVSASKAGYEGRTKRVYMKGDRSVLVGLKKK